MSVVSCHSFFPRWSFRSVPVTLEQSLGLGFLASLHPLRDDVGEPSLADHLQDVLAIELSVHQHVIDVNEVLSRIEQVFDDFQSCLPLSDGARVQHDWDGIADQLYCRPLVGVLVTLLFRSDDFVFVARPVTGERVGFGNVDGDDSGSKELLCLRNFV
ncbi:hypothetical protein SAMN05216564_10786 [Halopenitus persicus]|uniref:Uncharacterized protein n=1 Tax=Halopenitus persicus TaxID=1048396 RepID=A0A1H3LIG2_9EURY|nr:hypothetical protein SAMN05216564_10786 [Halopenitus persicus]